MSKGAYNFVTLFVLFPFFFSIGFGLSHSLGMEMKDDGTMGGCMFDGQAEICQMTFVEHLSRWQDMFTVIPQKSILLIQLLILVSTFVFAALALRQHLLLLLFSYFSEQWRFYVRNNPHLPLFYRLREAFSQGILNPKIYNSATL